MIWLVVITVIGGPDGNMATPIALAGSEPLCTIIGSAFAKKLALELPGAVVGFSCQKQVSA